MQTLIDLPLFSPLLEHGGPSLDAPSDGARMSSYKIVT